MPFNFSDPRFLNAAGNALSDLGYGLSTSKGGLGDALSLATQRTAQQDPIRQQEAAKAKAIADQAALAGKYSSFLLKQGEPELAQGVADGLYTPAEGWTKWMDKKAGGGAPSLTTDQSNYEYAQSHPGFMDFQTQNGGGAETSLTATWLIDNDPNSATFNQPVIGQLNKAGLVVKSKLPPGVTAMSPIDLAGGKARSTADGKAAGAAGASLPGAEQAYAVTQTALSNFDPGNQTPAALGVRAGQVEEFSKLLGMPTGHMIGAIPGTNKSNFRNIVEQLSGDAFLQIRQALKGAGQVTDYEGQKGEIAISRMKAAAYTGDETAFKQALTDYKDAMDNGMRLLREQAQGNYAQGQPGVTGGGASDPVAAADALLNSGKY